MLDIFKSRKNSIIYFMMTITPIKTEVRQQILMVTIINEDLPPIDGEHLDDQEI